MLKWFSSARALVQPFVQICLLRQGPQDLPTSGILLGITLSVHTLMSMVLANISLGTLSAVLSGLLDSTLLVVLTGSLLYIQRRSTRLVQTVTALAGTGSIITFLAIPLSGMLHGAEQGAGEGGLALILLLVLTGWSLAIAAHIFRHALSVPYFVGLVLAVVFYWISISVFRALFPVAA